MSAISGHWRLPLVGALLILLYAPTAVWLWNRWTLSIWHHAHGLLITPIIGYIVWKKLREMSNLPPDACAWGFLILIPALFLRALDSGMHTQLVSAFSLFLALPGLSLLFLGKKRTLAILFPLFFFLFTLPIPLVFTESIHLALRNIATVATSNIIPHLGIPVYTEGTVLHIPNGALQVADACSGFSTLYASIVIACLIAYLNPNVYRRTLVLLGSIPIAIGANIIRVVLLVLLVDWKGISILDSSLHTISGLFTFALAIPLLLWIGHVPATPGTRP